MINYKTKKEESPSKVDYLNKLIQVYKETPGHEIKEMDLSKTTRLT
jgi:hypothetical protein